MNKYKEVLSEILEIINFEDDRNQFIEEFTKMVYLQVINNLILTLAKEEQERIKATLSISTSADELSSTLKSYFNEEQTEQSIVDAVSDSLVKFVDSLKDSLSTDQEEKLLTFLQALR